MAVAQRVPPPKVLEGEHLNFGALSAVLPADLCEKVARFLRTILDGRRTRPCVVSLTVADAPVWVHLPHGLRGPLDLQDLTCVCFLDAPWGGAAATAIHRAQRDGWVAAADADAVTICGERIVVGRAYPLPETSAELDKWLEWSPVFMQWKDEEDDVGLSAAFILILVLVAAAGQHDCKCESCPLLLNADKSAYRLKAGSRPILVGDDFGDNAHVVTIAPDILVQSGVVQLGNSYYLEVLPNDGPVFLRDNRTLFLSFVQGKLCIGSGSCAAYTTPGAYFGGLAPDAQVPGDLFYVTEQVVLPPLDDGDGTAYLERVTAPTGTTGLRLRTADNSVVLTRTQAIVGNVSLDMMLRSTQAGVVVDYGVQALFGSVTVVPNVDEPLQYCAPLPVVEGSPTQIIVASIRSGAESLLGNYRYIDLVERSVVSGDCLEAELYPELLNVHCDGACGGSAPKSFRLGTCPSPTSDEPTELPYTSYSAVACGGTADTSSSFTLGQINQGVSLICVTYSV